jgi:dihydrofolate synthase/folylpolyglutamate synthase
LNFDLSIIQKKNLSCAVYALEKFGFSEIRQLVHRQDFFDKLFFGRFQTISKNPEIIIDVAHNEDSIKNLVNTLSTLDLKKTFLVFSILKDKNFKEYAGFFKTLKNQIEWFVAPLNSPRTESIDQLTKILNQNKLRFTSFLSIRDAYIQAINNAQKNDRIVVFGSFYVISEIFKDDYGGK